MFTSNYLTLPSSGRKIYYIHSSPNDKPAVSTPILAIHGLGGSSSFWLPALQASGLAEERDIYAYDFDGHGKSDFSGRESLCIDDLVQDLEQIIQVLELKTIVLAGHSMNGIVTSIFTERHPEVVEKLILLHPVRNPAPATADAMRKRAQAASTPQGLSAVANTVASSAVSKVCAATDYSATAFIRHMVATTKPEAYAAACLALATAPPIDGSKLQVSLHIIGGDEDYLAGPKAVGAWASEIPCGKGTSVVLENVGHWGAVEAPLKVGKALAQALAPTSYHILLGTFRSPYLYTLHFDAVKRKLELLHTNDAVGGHSWLDLSPSKSTLYTTVWGSPPTVSSYAIVPPSVERPYPTIKHQGTVSSENLSGYVCSNKKAMYSACGPQVDVFPIDEATGALKQGLAAQSFSLVSKENCHKGTSQMDFGGLRHGGHSCDLSPDGTKLYVADIGRNCVWMYHVDVETGLLTEASKNVAKRGHDGPRHAWPHPNGKIVYSLQEHSSYVDILQLSEDGQRLEWLEGVNILPEGECCHKYWADEVRLSPDADILFGSTRGLEADTKGFVTAWRLRPDGRLDEHSDTGHDTAVHRIQTRTSGGWANAIAVCPNLGPQGDVFLTLTDSEEGFIQVLSYTALHGFKVLDEVPLGSENEHVGASVAVWL